MDYAVSFRGILAAEGLLDVGRHGHFALGLASAATMGQLTPVSVELSR